MSSERFFVAFDKVAYTEEVMDKLCKRLNKLFNIDAKYSISDTPDKAWIIAFYKPDDISFQQATYYIRNQAVSIRTLIRIKNEGGVRGKKTDKVVEFNNDPVNHPSHYTQGGIECIDAMRASMTNDEFIGYLKGCVFKYLWRYENKGNPKQDLEKAQWYLNRLHDEYSA